MPSFDHAAPSETLASQDGPVESAPAEQFEAPSKTAPPAQTRGSVRQSDPKAPAQTKTAPEQDVAAPLTESLVDAFEPMAAQTRSGTVNESGPASEVPIAEPIQRKGPTQPPVAPSFPDAAAPPPKRLAKLFLSKPPARWPPERLSLALQGGGSFGAFAWGVLDRMLEDLEIEFDAVSGSSAGAVNAVLLASGITEGGREGARD